MVMPYLRAFSMVFSASFPSVGKSQRLYSASAFALSFRSFSPNSGLYLRALRTSKGNSSGAAMSIRRFT